jgi:hypothetical protein
MLGTSWCNRVWPSRQREEELNPPDIFLSYEDALSRMWTVPDDKLRSRLFDLSVELYRSELERRRHAEARSNATLTVGGITFALAGGLFGLFGKEFGTALIPWKLIIATYLGAMMYLVGSLMAALRVYGPSSTNIIDPVDLAPTETETETEYIVRYSCRLVEYTIKNYKENNRVLESVFISQQRLRYGIGLLFVALLMFVGGYIVRTDPGSTFQVMLRTGHGTRYQIRFPCSGTEGMLRGHKFEDRAHTFSGLKALVYTSSRFRFRQHPA